MKKIISILLAVLLFCLTFTACDNKNTSSNSNSSGSSSSGNKDVANLTEKKDKLIIKPTKSDDGAFKVGETLKSKNNKLQNIELVVDGKVTYKKYEFAMDIPDIPEDYNVYDGKDVELLINLVSSTGVKITMPGYYNQEFKYDDSGRQLGATDEAKDFRLRVSFTEEGTWDFTIVLKLKGEEVDSATGYINVTRAEDNRGYIKVEPTKKQVFTFDDGSIYVPIGQNIAWANNSNFSGYSAEMMTYMRRNAEYGANYTRFWLGSFWLNIVTKSYAPNDFTGGLGSASQIDRIFDTLEEIDMYVCLTMFAHAWFAGPQVPEGENGWHSCPYSKANKGYLEQPADFFTDEQAKYDTKLYFRYLVARYGYSKNLMAWEFFNEVDSEAGEPDTHREWHVEMAEYIRSIDPYDHMLTTSTADRLNTLNINTVFDFMSLHWYNYNGVSNLAKYQKEMWQIYKKPVMFGETGLIHNVKKNVDEDLINFHQQNWVGVMGGGAGTAANWYWLQLDAVAGDWDFQVVSEMAQHIPWTSKVFFMVGTQNAKPSNKQVEVLGYRGDDFAYLWLYDSKFTHMNKSLTDFEDLTFRVKLKDGKYHVRWINTWTGVSMGKSVETAVDGELKLKAPKWNKDIAVTITKD